MQQRHKNNGIIWQWNMLYFISKCSPLKRTIWWWWCLGRSVFEYGCMYLSENLFVTLTSVPANEIVCFALRHFNDSNGFWAQIWRLACCHLVQLRCIFVFLLWQHQRTVANQYFLLLLLLFVVDDKYRTVKKRWMNYKTRIIYICLSRDDDDGLLWMHAAAAAATAVAHIGRQNKKKELVLVREHFKFSFKFLFDQFMFSYCVWWPSVLS